jgi:hypothetical protein
VGDNGLRRDARADERTGDDWHSASSRLANALSAVERERRWSRNEDVALGMNERGHRAAVPFNRGLEVAPQRVAAVLVAGHDLSDREGFVGEELNVLHVV